MKILVLMPLDEKWVYMAEGIYDKLPLEVRNKTFAMPMFMQYCITTKLTKNWVEAALDALISLKQIYAAAGQQGDLIVIGNSDKGLKYDAVFNFQDLEFDMPFKDALMDRVKTVLEPHKEVFKYISNLYTDEDSKMPLHNTRATADFLAAYLQTDPKIEQIEKEYRDKLKNGQYNQNNKA